jgi:hypothetical protein
MVISGVIARKLLTNQTPVISVYHVGYHNIVCMKRVIVNIKDYRRIFN